MGLVTIAEPSTDPVSEGPPAEPAGSSDTIAAPMAGGPVSEGPPAEPAGSIVILSPCGEVTESVEPLAARRGSLAGAVVGIIDNDMWRSMAIMADELSRLLVDRVGAAEVVVTTAGPMHGADPERYHQEMEAFHAEVDAVISGLGN